MNINEVLKMVIRSLVDQAKACIEYDLKCIDPPVLTSGMLRYYGIHSDHTIASFWKTLDKLIAMYKDLELYRSKYMNFKFVLQHRVDDAYRIANTNIYVDPIDCSTRKCVVAPHTHVLKIYIKGFYEDKAIVELNVIGILKIVLHYEPILIECLSKFVENPFSTNSVLKLVNCIYNIVLRHREVLSELLDTIPTSLDSFIKRSPLLRHIVKHLDISELYTSDLHRFQHAE